MKKTGGFATTSSQDYRVALCTLVFIRALRLARDFFLVSNPVPNRKFGDAILYYRLEEDRGQKYRAIFVQARHWDKFTQKKLTSSNPFRLKDHLDSFREVKRDSGQPVNVQRQLIELQEFSVILYTSTGCATGEAADDVTNVPQVQHLRRFLNTGGRLLRIPDARRVGLTEGEETSDFLSHLLLCTEQMSVETASGTLEEELRSLLKLTSRDMARNLNAELKRVMKAWWGEGTGRYLTAESAHAFLQMQITRLNADTINIDSRLNFDFTEVSLEELKDVHHNLKKSWICVRDEYQANAVRSRLLRAQRNSLIVSLKSLEGHLEEVEALWRNNICPTLVLDVTKDSPEEGPPQQLLQRLQEAVVQGDAAGGRMRLVVIAEGNPTAGEGWREVDAEPTWSVLRQVTRDRLLEAPVRLRGQDSRAVALRDVIGSEVSDIMSDQVIDSLCECEREMKLGRAAGVKLAFLPARPRS